jgi:N6-adenosine-specific RNA methylase IME4
LGVSKYRTIVADPPWTPALNATAPSDPEKTKAQPWAFYETMSLEEIGSLAVPTEGQAHLWLWALSQHVDWGYEVARAWGFDPWITLTWCKPGLGVGRFQCNTEQVILARRGSRHGNPFGMTGGTWFNWPRGEHSAKPDAFYDLVESVSPGPYLELFARKQRLGWDTWGNEALNHVELSA